MKYLLLLLIALTLFGNVSGQKIELSASLNSGLFSFRGNNGVYKNTVIYGGSFPYSDHGLVSDYGGRNGLSYGASFNFKKVYKDKYFWGVDLGYEVLRSKANIDHALVYHRSAIEPHSVDSTFLIDISGKVFTMNSFVNINPFVGYRINYKEFKFDLITGFDLGYYLKFATKVNATRPDGIAYEMMYNPTTRSMYFDFRPRLQLSSNYKKIGVYIGYSYGLSNYNYQFIKSNPDLGIGWISTKSKLIRFGVSYQLK